MNPPALRRLPHDEAAFRREFGAGRTLAADGSLTLRPARHDAPIALTLITPAGVIALSRGQHWLRLASGIDVGDESEAGADWLLTLAVSKLPAPVKDALAVGDAAWGDAAPAEALWLAFSWVDPGGGRHDFVAAASASVWLALIARPEWRALEPEPLPDAALTATPACVIGRATLSAEHCARLRRGDAVLLQRAFFDAEGDGRIALGERSLRVALRQRPDGVGLEFLGWDEAMNDSKHATDAGGAIDMGAVPVELGFELGRLSLTVAELRRLTPGAVLELDAGAAPPWVTIHAGGRAIGRGELVEIDGRLAVQIADFALAREAEPA